MSMSLRLIGAGGRLKVWFAALVFIGLCAACSDLDQDAAEASRAEEPSPTSTTTAADITSTTSAASSSTTPEERLARRAEFLECVDGIVPKQYFDPTLDLDEHNRYYVARIEAMIECDPGFTADREVTSNLAREVALYSVAAVDGFEMACLLDEVIADSDDPAKAIVNPVTDPEFRVIFEAVHLCLDPNSVRLLGLFDLSEMSEACQAGDDIVCDLLYFETPVGSEHEALGVSCGGRGNGIDFCTDGIELDENGEIDSASYGITSLMHECEDAGSMGACDLLVYLALEDTEPYVVGTTCGGRRDESIDSFCRNDYP